MKHNKTFSLSIILIAVLILLIVAQTYVPHRAFAQGKATPIPTIMSDTTISVSLNNPVVPPGGEFDIAVNISTDTPTWSAQLILVYDPSKIEIISASEGAFYGDWAVANGVSTFVLPQEPDNDAGQAVFAVTLLGAPAGQGPTGQGSLVQYRARAKPDASGDAEIGMEEVIVSDTAINDAQKIQTQKLGGIKVQGGLLTIGSEAAAAPAQPTPEALLEPTATIVLSPTPEPTIARRSNDAQGGIQQAASSGASGSGVPWIILVPVVGVVVVGGLVFMLSRRK